MFCLLTITMLSLCGLPFLLVIIAAASSDTVAGGGVQASSSPSRSEILPCNYTLSEFETITDVINASLAFFEDNLEGIILDTAMGTRTLEAQISLVLNRSTYSNVPLPNSLEGKLEAILAKSTELTPYILEVFIKDPEISVLTKMKQWQWISSSDQWRIPFPNQWRPMTEMEEYFNFTTLLRNDFNYFRDKFHPILSDTCISQVFQCRTEAITDDCKDYFFTTPQSSYTLNHQILYVLMAETRFCHKRELYHETFADVGGWDKFRKDLCGKVWKLANVITKRGYSPRYADMFAEQVAVCSLAGYPNFLRKDWLHKILSWHSKADGCFVRLDHDNRIAITTESDDDYVDVEPPQERNFDHLIKKMRPEQLVPFYPWQIITQKPKRRLKRVKRGERIVLTEAGNYCGFHSTAMGMMVLAVHLRYFTETCSHRFHDLPLEGTELNFQ